MVRVGEHGAEYVSVVEEDASGISNYSSSDGNVSSEVSDAVGADDYSSVGCESASD